VSCDGYLKSRKERRAVVSESNQASRVERNSTLRGGGSHRADLYRVTAGVAVVGRRKEGKRVSVLCACAKKKMAKPGVCNKTIRSSSLFLYHRFSHQAPHQKPTLHLPAVGYARANSIAIANHSTHLFMSLAEHPTALRVARLPVERRDGGHTQP